MTTAESSPATANEGEASPQEATLLMVASHFGPRDELTRLLVEAGYRVLFPPSLAEAQARITSGDLLVVATEKPGEAEFGLLCALRDSETAWHVPVIIISEKADETALNSCLQLGAAEALSWPVDEARLKARMHGCLAVKQHWQLLALNLDLTARARHEAERLAASLIDLGVGMVKEKDPLQIMEMILKEAMRITDCEGGTIYMRGLDPSLHFLLVRNDMLDINMGGSTGKPITFPPLKLMGDDGKPNHQYVANHAALTGQTVNIEDAYSAGRFDFSGTRRFDANTGYRSKSFLTVPLKNERQQVIGVLQLINARDPKTGAIVRFDAAVQPTIEAFAVVAAAVLDAYRKSQLGITNL